MLIIIPNISKGLENKQEEGRLIECSSALVTSFEQKLTEGADTKSNIPKTNFFISKEPLVTTYKLISSNIAKYGRSIHCIYEGQNKYKIKRTIYSITCKQIKKIEDKNHSYYCY